MDTTDTDIPEEQTPAPPAPPEPTVGGSYTRDPVTGQLTRVSPVQAPAQPEEE